MCATVPSLFFLVYLNLLCQSNPVSLKLLNSNLHAVSLECSGGFVRFSSSCASHPRILTPKTKARLESDGNKSITAMEKHIISRSRGRVWKDFNTVYKYVSERQGQMYVLVIFIATANNN